jgi:hypothetical protein
MSQDNCRFNFLLSTLNLLKACTTKMEKTPQWEEYGPEPPLEITPEQGNRNIQYWYSTIGYHNRKYLNMKRQTYHGKHMTLNFEMSKVPEVIENLVRFYNVTHQPIEPLQQVLSKLQHDLSTTQQKRSTM